MTDADLLRRIAEARREYADRAPSATDRQYMLGECSALDAVAEVLNGNGSWSDLVADYAPSWRWPEFGEHAPLGERGT